MGYWLKKFLDGTEVRGTDIAVQQGSASWTRSRLYGMIGAEVNVLGHTLEIIGPGEYWQSDTYISQILSTNSTLCQRRIERRLEPGDRFFQFKSKGNRTSISFVPAEFLSEAMLVEVLPEWHGKWLVLEYDIGRQESRYYIKDHKV